MKFLVLVITTCFILFFQILLSAGEISGNNESNNYSQNIRMDSLFFHEGFEGNEFPPDGWEEISTAMGMEESWGRRGTTNCNGTYLDPFEGSKQAAVSWSFEPQNEWLITPSFYCEESSYLSFMTGITYGSTAGDHYYVKIKIEGSSDWFELWDATRLSAGVNLYYEPIIIDLADYSGENIKIAWQAIDNANSGYPGLWYDWCIDDINIFKTTSINSNYELAITNYELSQNYPNPFNPTTIINYQLSIVNYKTAEIVVHNSAGQSVWSTTVGARSSCPSLGTTNGSILFNGSKFNSGIYYYSLIVDGKKIDTKSMILIK